ncbi:Hypothetical protein FKW44_018841 [Caligus rogercresseyi]|uniref:Uncharacterized protein n=1 Tax=Caligus rogercresseyi TaxID=217165 RepID=A0A7T8GV05_CALRO|nr:Hypothetical protein FKW44_018841 [Caligus rogercresseyi]
MEKNNIEENPTKELSCEVNKSQEEGASVPKALNTPAEDTDLVALQDGSMAVDENPSPPNRMWSR